MFFRKILQKESADFILVTDEKPKKNKVKCQEKWRGPAYRPRRTGHFEFSVLPYTCHEIESAEHIFELPASYATVLRILDMQTGVGGDESWGAWAHEPYLVKGEEPRSFTFQVHLLG